MVFKNDLVGHFVILAYFSEKRWWISKFLKGTPLELSPKWAEKKFSEYQKSDLISQNGQLNLTWITQKNIGSYNKKFPQ